MRTGRLFSGTQDDCKRFVRRLDGWYVYVLRRPDGRPFYVGKGKGERVFQHENEARHPNRLRSNAIKLNVIRKILSAGSNIQYEIDLVTVDENTALTRETVLIGAFKRLHEGGPLTNLDPGNGSAAGSSPISKARHAATLAGEPGDSPDRAILNRFVLNVAPMRSVIFKPTAQFEPLPTRPYPLKTMAPTLRQAAALIGSAAANGITMEAGCRIPRRVVVEGVSGLVENGVACDIVTSGLGKLSPAPDPAEECFELNESQAKQAVGLVGLVKCVDLGVLSTAALCSGPVEDGGTSPAKDGRFRAPRVTSVAED